MPDADGGRCSTWRINFWSQWRKEYVHNLQAKPKWKQEQRNLAAGKTRKATVFTSKDGRRAYEWLISALVLLAPSNDYTVGVH